MIIFIDSGVLGVLSSSQKTDTVFQCKQWFYQLLARGFYVTSSDLCDYEVRRSLFLNKIKNPVAIQSLNNLDELQRLIVATTNVKHLSRFVEAKTWQEVKV